MQRFPLHRYEELKSPEVLAIAILGTIHNTRWRWNPFDTENRMHWDEEQGRWQWSAFLRENGGRHGDGVYVCRMVVNHNMRRVLKGNWHEPSSAWKISETALGEKGSNISFSIAHDGEYTLCLSGDRSRFWVDGGGERGVLPYPMGTNFQLNGFPWDDSDLFSKFDERLPGRDLQQLSNKTWEILLPLKSDGGIDFRGDGVYQFLLSADQNEDMGLAALNHTVSEDGRSIRLVTGTGFGSSHGSCEHSPPTIKVSADGLYRFSLSKQEQEAGHSYCLECSSEGKGQVSFLNSWSTIHLLGSVHENAPFDPTQAATFMLPDERTGAYVLEMEMGVGSHVINFGLGGELFLDTMGLGCWLENGSRGELRGIAWHGKPNESNICFQVLKAGTIRFRYLPSEDLFTIEHTDGEAHLRRVEGITELSLVGSFDTPMVAWDPTAEANLMRWIGDARFERCLLLEEGRSYEYKYVGNRSNWHLVFADYELDGYGSCYGGEMNPSPMDTSLEQLKIYGHLTTHGNPPAISFTPRESGLHRFVVDLRTGAYSVIPLR